MEAESTEREGAYSGECLFCRIVAKEIPARIVYEDSDVVAFEDIHPQAPVHVLIIPRKHISTLNQLEREDISLAGKILFVATEMGRRKDIHVGGYRIVVNCNRDGGQSVFHLHAHLLGGREMKWPPG
jgi:histidine triad (HIT) family protein